MALQLFVDYATFLPYNSFQESGVKFLNERIKEMRKALDLTQQEFADKLGVARNNIAGYETGKRNPSNAVISLICNKFNANEEWLRTGEGKMFIEVPEEDIYSKAAASVFKENDATAIEGLKLYYSLSPEAKKAVRNYILQLADMIREHENKEE